ncbi:lamin tail domain-containing protein [Streptomyces sp. NPDC002004]
MSASTSARRITAAAMVAGALVGAAAVPASADHHGPWRDRPQVEISHVQYDSPGHDDRSLRSLNHEWVDISNTTRRTVDLDGWTLSARDGRTYTFHHLRLMGYDTVRVHSGMGHDTYRDVYQDRRFYVWDNYSDTATLRNDHGRIVDAVSWGTRRHH